MRRWGLLRTRIDAILVFSLISSLMIPGRLRFDKSVVHLGGAELAISPFYLAVLGWISAAVIFRTSRISFDTPAKIITCYIFGVFCSIFFSTDPYWSVLEFTRILACFLIFMFLAESFRTTQSYKAMAAAFVFIIITQIFYTVAQLQTGVAVSGFSGQEIDLSMTSATSFRIVGTLGHPGTLAQFLTIIFPLMLACFVKANGGHLKIAALIAIPALISLSQSRTGIALFAISIFFISLAYVKYGKSGAKKAWVSVASIVIFCAGTAVLWPTITARFVKDESFSGEVRTELATVAIKMISNNPVWGVGLNNFTEVMKAYDETGVSNLFLYPVHNIYLLVAAETGGVGILLFILLNVYFVILGFRNIKQYGANLLRCVSFYAVNALMVIYLTGLLGWAWKTDSIFVLYWACFAIIVSDYRTIKADRYLVNKPSDFDRVTR